MLLARVMSPAASTVRVVSGRLSDWPRRFILIVRFMLIASWPEACARNARQHALIGHRPPSSHHEPAPIPVEKLRAGVIPAPSWASL